MPGPIDRNHVVKYFGQPDVTEGTVNEPREREELGLKFNEKWVYKHPVRDPSDAAERAIFWRRYDFVGSAIKRDKHDDWQRDDSLPSVLSR
ncbi:MAG: hypothetical protein HY270_10845 [Deltaproteobacteria bacterium]|nr:hypothetical protein [Deltaproteobacteria bacterium]